MAPSDILIVFLVLNERRFLFSSADVTFNAAIIETLNAYLNALLNERPHEEGYCEVSTNFERTDCLLLRFPILKQTIFKARECSQRSRKYMKKIVFLKTFKLERIDFLKTAHFCQLFG